MAISKALSLASLASLHAVWSIAGSGLSTTLPPRFAKAVAGQAAIRRITCNAIRYNMKVSISSFRDQGTEDVFDREDTKAARKACPVDLWKVTRRKEADQSGTGPRGLKSASGESSGGVKA
jgi:hypothetical protein